MITAWLGRDAPEIPDATARVAVEAPGWLLVVLRRALELLRRADELAGLVARLGGANLDATDLAEALVGFANAAGGADNITVAAARLAGPPRSDTLTTNTQSTDVAHADGDPTNPGA